jgi:hypothetical protein
MYNILQDFEMSRGKPLFLNEERYAALTYMVRKYSILTSHFIGVSIFLIPIGIQSMAAFLS